VKNADEQAKAWMMPSWAHKESGNLVDARVKTEMFGNIQELDFVQQLIQQKLAAQLAYIIRKRRWRVLRQGYPESFEDDKVKAAQAAATAIVKLEQKARRTCAPHGTAFQTNRSQLSRLI